MAVSPAMTFNSRGNVINNIGLGAGATQTGVVDNSTKFKVDIQVEVTFPGTISAVAGLQVNAWRRFTSGTNDDNNAFFSFVVPATAGTSQAQSFSLPTGKYVIQLRNLDLTNAITTGVYLTTSTLDSIG